MVGELTGPISPAFVPRHMVLALGLYNGHARGVAWRGVVCRGGLAARGSEEHCKKYPYFGERLKPV